MSYTIAKPLGLSERYLVVAKFTMHAEYRIGNEVSQPFEIRTIYIVVCKDASIHLKPYCAVNAAKACGAAVTTSPPPRLDVDVE